MNRIILTGNLTRDPELTETASGLQICRFAIAVNRPYADKDGERKTDYFNVVCYRTQAENVARYTLKGNKVLVEGSVQFREYTDKQGQKRNATEVIGERIEFLSPRPSAAGNAAPAERTGQLQMYDDGGDIPF